MDIGQGKIGTDDSHGSSVQEQWSIVNATTDTFYFKLSFDNGDALLGLFNGKAGSEGDILYQRTSSNNNKQERAMRFRLIPVDY